MEYQQQVIVAGAGPTGLLNALGLAQQGLDVTVVERSSEPSDAPRAILYHWSTLDGLERLGLFDDAARAGFLKQDYAHHVRDTGETINYGLKALEGRVTHPYNLHLGQGALAKIILRHLDQVPNVRVLWGHKITGLTQDDVAVTVTAQHDGNSVQLRAPWLIGADGAGSAVRSALNLPFEGFTWPERFVAANIRFPDDRKGWAQTTFYVDDVLGAIIVKIDNSGPHGLWRYTYMEDAVLPEEGVVDRLPRFLEQIFGPEVAAGTTLDAIAPYRMHQRSAPTYRVGRVLLAGDAAHATNPTGGFGLTMGLFDSYALNEALGALIKRNADDSILDAYSELRRSAFIEKASPRATANKQLIFHSSDPVQRNKDLELFRRMGKDPELAAAVLYFTKTLETPSLVRAQDAF